MTDSTTDFDSSSTTALSWPVTTVSSVLQTIETTADETVSSQPTVGSGGGGLSGQDDTYFNISASLVLRTLYWENETYMYWVCIALATIGIAGHLLTAIVMTASRKLFIDLYSFRNLLINQSCVDAIACFVLLLQTVIPIQIPGSEISGIFLCHVWLNKLLLWISITTCTYAMAVFSIERYIELIHPSRHKKFFTIRNVVIVVCATWLFSLAWNNSNQSTTKFFMGICIPFSFWKNKTGMFCFLGV